MKKKELMKLTKDKLVKKVIAIHSGNAYLRLLIVDGHAHIKWLQARLSLAERKINFLENKKIKGRKRDVINYSQLGHSVNTFQNSRVRNKKESKKWMSREIL